MNTMFDHYMTVCQPCFAQFIELCVGHVLTAFVSYRLCVFDGIVGNLTIAGHCVPCVGCFVWAVCRRFGVDMSGCARVFGLYCLGLVCVLLLGVLFCHDV